MASNGAFMVFPYCYPIVGINYSFPTALLTFNLHAPPRVFLVASEEVFLVASEEARVQISPTGHVHSFLHSAVHSEKSPLS